MEFLSFCRSKAQDSILSFDLEVLNKEINCWSLGYRDKEDHRIKVISIPLMDENGDYFSLEEEYEVLKLQTEILCDPLVKVLGQNLAFDCGFMYSKYGVLIGGPDKIIDTMIQQHTVMPDYPKSLEFITSVYTMIPYYKNDGKEWFKVGGAYQTLWMYNAYDSISCLEAMGPLEKNVTVQKNQEVYQQKLALVLPLVKMMTRGIKVDRKNFQALTEIYTKKVEEKQAELDKLAGEVLNVNSPKLKDYFYGKLGYAPYFNRKTKAQTTDGTALQRLERKGCKEAGLCREIRGLRKLLSTYLNEEKLDPDDRIRCSYNPVGTKFSRISSSENIFGTGMNLQNWPGSMQVVLMVDGWEKEEEEV